MKMERSLQNETSGFVELSRTTSAVSGGMVEIIINNPIQIRVPQGVSLEELRTVLQAVKEL